MVLLVSIFTSHNCLCVKVPMSTSSDPNHYHDADSKSSLEQSPVIKTDITEPNTPIESELAKFACTESTAAESKVVFSRCHGHRDLKMYLCS